MSAELSVAVPVEKSIAPRLLGFARAIEILCLLGGILSGLSMAMTAWSSSPIVGVILLFVGTAVGWFIGIVSSASLRWMAEVLQALIGIRASVER